MNPIAAIRARRTGRGRSPRPMLRPSTVAATVELEILADEVVQVAQQIKRTVEVLKSEDERRSAQSSEAATDRPKRRREDQ